MEPKHSVIKAALYMNNCVKKHFFGVISLFEATHYSVEITASITLASKIKNFTKN